MLAAALIAASLVTGTGLDGNFNDEFANTCQGDLNGDGLPDLVISQHDRKPTLLMYNNGDYTYRVGAQLDNGDPHGCAIYRSTSGQLHLLFAIGAFHGTVAQKQNNDWVRNGSSWELQPGFFGVSDPSGRGRQIFPVRMLEGQGVYVANTFPVDYTSTNHLYVEDRPGHMVDQGAPFTNTTFGQSAAVADVDGDGADEIVATGGQRIRVWHESSVGKWVDVAPAWGVNVSGRRAAFGDINGDGKPDLVTSGDAYVVVYINSGGTLHKTYTLPIKAGRSPYIGDLTGDGKADVYVATGSVKQASMINEPDQLLVGDGTGRFAPTTAFPQVTRGAGNDVTRIASPPGTVRLLITNGGDMNDAQSGAHEVLQFPGR